MNKLKLNKETLRKLNVEDTEQVAAGLPIPTQGRTCLDNCTDSCVMTRKPIICCF